MNIDSYKVSLIIVTYNQVEYIEGAILSALQQKVKSEIDLIVTDDCSTDGTWELILSLAEKYSFTATSTSSNQGVVGNLLNGFSVSQGDYIFLMGGDDLSQNDRITKSMKVFLEDEEVYAIYSDTKDIDAYGKDIEGNKVSSGKKYYERNSNMDRRSFIENDLGVLGCTAAYKRQVFEYFGSISNLMPSEDKILTFRALLLGKIQYIDEKLVSYRLGVGISNNLGHKSKTAYIKLLNGKLNTYKGYLNDGIFSKLNKREVIAIKSMVEFYSFAIDLMNKSNFLKLVKAMFYSNVKLQEKLRLLYYYVRF